MSSCLPFSLRNWLRHRTKSNQDDAALPSRLDVPLIESEDFSGMYNSDSILEVEQRQRYQQQLEAIPPIDWEEQKQKEWLDRLALLSWSHQICKYKKLPNTCLQLQMHYFQCLMKQKPDIKLISDQAQLILCVAMSEAARHYGYPRSFDDLIPDFERKEKSFRLMCLEVSKIETKIEEFERQSKLLVRKLDPVEHCCYDFLIVLRWSIPFVCALPIRSQLIACIAATEWLCSGHLIIAWKFICKLIEKQLLSNLEQAWIRRAINELITALSSLTWCSGKWPNIWFDQEIEDDQIRNQVAQLIRDVVPLRDGHHSSTPDRAYIWLLSPSVLC